ncbi:hypothetical protein ABZY19_07260 [Streptomyces sp. NPDC006475]|nr:hypothetical protein OG317_21455 [Streptomyces sp. NBC_01167]
MCVMRKVLLAVSAAVVLVIGMGGASAGARVIAPEADVAHHGHVSLTGGRMGIALVSQSYGPASLDNATVKLTFSVPLAGAQVLPERCLWGSDRVVLCAAGALRAGGTGRTVALDLRTLGVPDEVVVKVGTHWNGGATDRNSANNEHEVLVLSTGDPYVF